MQIYFVRHGRTQFNLEHRFQGGRSDSPLTADGIAGARAAGRYLATTEFGQVYSSPQQRALDTAAYIVAENQFKPAVTVAPGFREFDFGTWDGQKEADVQPRAYAQVLLKQPGVYDPQRAGGGESYATFVARTTAAVHAIVDQATDARPVLVGFTRVGDHDDGEDVAGRSRGGLTGTTGCKRPDVKNDWQWDR